MKRSNEIFLKDILKAIGDIERFSQGLTYKEFSSQDRDYLAIIKCFEIIGEAVKYLEESIKDTYTTIPWKRIASFRDVLSHEYFAVDTELVWNVIQNRLPELKRDVLRILKDFEKNQQS